MWLKLIDRTGLGPGTAWRDTVRNQVVGKLKAAMPIPLQVTWQNGARFNLWTPDGQTHTAEAFALTPVGAVFIGWNAASAARTTCAPGGDPYQPPPTYSYCRGDSFHISRAVVAVGGDGVGPTALNATATHELGHALGLTHRIVNANGACDGQSAMCGFGYLNFDAHDKAELATRYGHTP